jgi:hypothetical protein
MPTQKTLKNESSHLDNKSYIYGKKMTKQLGNTFEHSKAYVIALQQLGNRFQTKKMYFISSQALVLNMKLLLLPCSNHQDHHTLSLSHNFKVLIKDATGSQPKTLLHSLLQWPSTNNNGPDIHNLP